MTDTTPTAQTTTANVTSPVVTDGPQPVVTSPVVEPGNGDTPPAVVTPDPAGAAPNADPAATDPAAHANKTTPEWAQKRINELTAKRYEAERATATEREKRVAAEKAASDLLARTGGGAPNGSDPAKPAVAAISDEEMDRRVNERAAQIAAAKVFNDACDNVAETGKKEFAASWDDALKNLGLVGAIGQNVAPDFLQTAIELQSPHKVLHYLGSNLEEAERVAKLPPTRMALEMARIEAKLNAPVVAAAPAAPVIPPISGAPAPVIPVGGQAKPGVPSLDDPNVSSEDWYALRDKQVMEKRKRYLRVV